ncbi:MAG: FMN-binding glutamate synthase family protein [Candidatus Omnitrophica bacterium]|nr:FMN-binding glutamate synthase family protein [Candidatus Omnitrophota bacterium]
MLVGPILLIGLYDFFQTKNTILRNFPVIGHFRFLLMAIGPEIHQYFVESDTDGKPIDRNHRDYVYERAKQTQETHPFGTELNVYEIGYEWMHHSVYPSKRLGKAPRVQIGGPDCRHPYSASILNISAMSFGALSSNAVTALNIAAREGGFFHDTGEGAISPYHLQGGDLVYEIGTGYFGCRSEDGGFSLEKYREQAARPEVKMIELKLSQGAKPGHGGVLPAAKNSEEIADIRGVEPHTDIISPPGHSAFHDAHGLLDLIATLREASDGKPVGFKLCVGDREEFREICVKMVETGIKPDFITVDGAEGGTGAAPIDFSNYVGMAMEEGLVCVVDLLTGYDLKKDIKVFVASKIITAFDIFRALCLGADLCNSARGMMLALGCIQALKCNTNECPTGVTTSDPDLRRGLVVEEKWVRVKNYHASVIDEFLGLLAAAGVRDLTELNRRKIYKRTSSRKIEGFDELYPEVKPGAYLKNLSASRI